MPALVESAGVEESEGRHNVDDGFDMGEIVESRLRLDPGSRVEGEKLGNEAIGVGRL